MKLQRLKATLRWTTGLSSDLIPTYGGHAEFGVTPELARTVALVVTPNIGMLYAEGLLKSVQTPSFENMLRSIPRLRERLGLEPLSI